MAWKCCIVALVTPLAGVWIEIFFLFSHSPTNQSLPLRECGLKFYRIHHKFHLNRVTPLAGVWIEIPLQSAHFVNGVVTPLAGVWIEILTSSSGIPLLRSHSPCGSVD